MCRPQHAGLAPHPRHSAGRRLPPHLWAPRRRGIGPWQSIWLADAPERTRAFPGRVHPHPQTFLRSRAGVWGFQSPAGAQHRHEDDAAAHRPSVPEGRARPSAGGRGRPGGTRRGRGWALACLPRLCHGGWRPASAGGHRRRLGRGPPRRVARAPAPQPTRHEIEQQDDPQAQQEEELLTCHRCLYGLGPAGGSSPVSAMASRIDVSACTFFIR
jgi:hypothetical protein